MTLFIYISTNVMIYKTYLTVFRYTCAMIYFFKVYSPLIIMIGVGNNQNIGILCDELAQLSYTVFIMYFNDSLLVYFSNW